MRHAASTLHEQHWSHAVQEVRALSTCLDHPGILSLAGAHFDRSHLYVLTELAPLGSLDNFLVERVGQVPDERIEQAPMALLIWMR